MRASTERAEQYQGADDICALEHPPDTAPLHWRNAFNIILRGAMLSAIAMRQPTLLPFAAKTCKQTDPLLVDGMLEDTPSILS